MSTSNTRLTISPPIHFDAQSGDAASGYALAQEVWIVTADGIDQKEAARRFAEGILTIAATETAETLAGYVYGAACLFLEVAPTPRLVEAAK